MKHLQETREETQLLQFKHFKKSFYGGVIKITLATAQIIEKY